MTIMPTYVHKSREFAWFISFWTSEYFDFIVSHFDKKTWGLNAVIELDVLEPHKFLI